MAFKVGDKVVNEVYGKGEIVYGPFFDTSYFFKAEDGRHYTVTESLCKPAAKFEVGDRVKTFAATYIVEAGPFFAPGEWYVVKSDRTGNVLHSTAEGMSLIAPESAKDETVKVGDVVRILEDGAFFADVKAGDLFEVKEVFTDSWDDEQRVRVDADSDARRRQWTFRPQDDEDANELERVLAQGRQ